MKILITILLLLFTFIGFSQTKTFIHEGRLNDTLAAIAPLQPVAYGTTTVGGTSKVVSDANVKEGYLILVYPSGALVNVGTLSVDNVQEGQFTLRSTNFLDSRSVNYLIFKEN